jgi:hypothetical protein
LAPRLRTVAALSVAGAVPAVLGGVVFWAVQGDTTVTHAIAFGLWFAAAVLFLGMLVTTSKSLWRRTTIAIPEGWMFLSAAVVLTALGAAIDVA